MVFEGVYMGFYMVLDVFFTILGVYIYLTKVLVGIWYIFYRDTIWYNTMINADEFPWSYRDHIKNHIQY